MSEAECKDRGRGGSKMTQNPIPADPEEYVTDGLRILGLPTTEAHLTPSVPEPLPSITATPVEQLRYRMSLGSSSR